MEVYVYLNGTKRGPFAREQVQRMIADGVLQETDLAAPAADGEWKALRELNVNELADLPAPVPPVSSAPQPSPNQPDHPRVSHDSLGAYARATITANETVYYKTAVHWIVFARYAFAAFLVFLFVAIPFGIAVQAFTASQLGWFALPLPMFILLPPAVLFSTSELVVTDRRVLIKTGALERQTLEMFVWKIESVGVHQSFLGRLLDYGTVVIRGTGGSEEPFPTIAHPIEFRNAVQQLQTNTTGTQ